MPQCSWRGSTVLHRDRIFRGFSLNGIAFSTLMWFSPCMKLHAIAVLVTCYFHIAGAARIALVAALLSLGFAASGAAPSNDAINQLAADYFAKRPSQSLHAGLTIGEARGAQKEFVARLTPKLGRPVGYKVGLTSKAVQESVGASTPVRGVLLRDMMLKDGARVSAQFGARPIWEPDLIVVVKDAGINSAKTPLDVARHLSEVVAFIELPDRIVAETEKVDGNLITALNTSARLGVLGQRVKVEATAAFLAALENMTVTASDQTGTELAKAKGDALLGHPLKPVLWLLEDLAATGETLKGGDLISLGSFARPEAPRAGQTVTVRYDGLPGGPLKVSVRFSE
jgi:2-keto-4-pentenoate hydratase